MLENDASILKDAAQFYWFGVPITPVRLAASRRDRHVRRAAARAPTRI